MDNAFILHHDEILISSSLRNIDNFTRKFESLNDLKRAFNLGSFEPLLLAYIVNPNKKVFLPIFINEEEVKDFLDAGDFSEFEKVRKLLYSSKDFQFLKNVLNTECSQTFYGKVRLTPREIKEVEKYFFVKEDSILARDLLSLYAQGVKKIGRPVEKALDSWKEEMLELPENARYYFARRLKLLRSEYENSLIESKVKNVEVFKIIDSNYLKTEALIIRRAKRLIRKNEDS